MPPLLLVLLPFPMGQIADATSKRGEYDPASDPGIVGLLGSTVLSIRRASNDDFCVSVLGAYLLHLATKYVMYVASGQ
jgi:hypothetical protein